MILEINQNSQNKIILQQQFPMQQNKRPNSGSAQLQASLPSNQMSVAFNSQQMQQDFQDLQNLFTKVNSYSICYATGRIAVNLPEGLAIVQNGIIKKYYESDSPFRGKTGVRLSRLLPFSQLIAVVPQSAASIIPTHSTDMKSFVLARTVPINPFTVYVYDLSSKTLIYQKDFNCQIDYVRITQKYLAVGNAKRVVFLDYRKNLESNSRGNSNQLQGLIEGYKIGEYDESARYVEIEGAGDWRRGEIKSSLVEPVRFAFIKEEKKTLSVFDTDLNIFIDIELDKLDKDFCLSPDGKYVAIITQGGIDIKILEINTRTLFTEFKRGLTEKQLACFGFCQGWFGLASQTAASATFHFFPLRKKKEPQQIIYSQYKRYFNTFRQPVDFFVRNNRVFVFSQIGCTFMILELDRAKLKHGEPSSRNIESHQIVMWKPES